MDEFGMTMAQINAAGAHWTAREVLQQPALWAQTEQLIAAESARLSGFLEPLLGRSELRVVLTGAGTSAHIGKCLAPALTRIYGRRIDAIASTDLVASPHSYLSAQTPTLLVSFGRSGNSPESVAAIERADACVPDCWHLIITCDPEGALYRRARQAPRCCAILMPAAANDRSYAMTSSFTVMLLAAALVLRAVPANGARALGLARLAQQLLAKRLPLLQELVRCGFNRVVYLGSKEFKGLAREAALKMLELTDGRVVAIGDSPLGFRHGPKTILNSDTLVIVFVGNDDYARQYDWDLIDELRHDAVAGRVVALAARPGVRQHPDDVIAEALRDSMDISDLELCLPYAVFAQSLALLRSISLGLLPDNPNATGTVSRVVTGVSIHPLRGGA
ncbi:MAG TPA: SIS domain-containing protein [Steroidobacteraceae bacterium]